MIRDNPDAENIGFIVCNLAKEMEQNQVLPAGSSDIITKGTNDFLAVTDFNTGINVWGNLFNKYKVDPNYMNTPLVGILSIGYYSAQYWAYIIHTSTGGTTNHQPVPSPNPFSLKRWIKALLGDVSGALSGAADGAGLGSVVPGLGDGCGAHYRCCY